MTYKVFATDMELAAGVSQPDLSKLQWLGADSRDAGLEMALRLIENNAIVWKIEGPDGFQMTRTEIEAAYHSKTGKWPRA
jgi:hypothetical protein